MSGFGSVGEGLVELALDRGSTRPTLGFGGDAANICLMAARLGTSTRICGRVGNDGLGDRLLRHWRDQGIDVSSVTADPRRPTGIYVNERAENEEHRFLYYRSDSAGSGLEPGDVGEAFYGGLEAVVITGVTMAISVSAAATAEAAIARAAALGIRSACVLNHRPSLAGDNAALAAAAAGCDVVIGSVEDATAVFGVATAGGLVEALGGATPEIVLSEGEIGATAIAAGDVFQQPAPRVSVTNTSGAGDALAGSYLSQRLAGREPGEALAWGVAASSLSVQREGCASSYPSKREVLAQLRLIAPWQRRSR